MSKDLSSAVNYDVLGKMSRELSDPEKMQEVESKLLTMEQADCPVQHHFGPGIYIREVRIKAGVFSIGHHQNFEHLNHMLQGRVIMLNPDGTTSELSAPAIFTSPPGRKVGLIVEDMIWHNIYATDETDINVLEETYLTKSDSWKENNDIKFNLDYYTCHNDRKDFRAMLDEIGVPPEVVRAQSENEDDQVPFPSYIKDLRVMTSPIEGNGFFASSDIQAGEIIAPARINGMRTPAGRYTNHALDPNAKMVLKDDGDFDLVAIKNIGGCKGGDSGEEITIDYRLAFKLSGRSKLCQE